MENTGVEMRRLKALWSDSRTYKNRLLISVCVCLGIAFTCVFFGPYETVAFSGESMLYSHTDVVGLLLTASVVFVAVTAPLLALLRGKIFNNVMSLAFGGLVAAYLQCTVLNRKTNLGTLIGDAVEWTLYYKQMFWNLLIWAAIIIAVLLVMYLNRTIWKNMLMGVSLALVLMQMVPAIGIGAGLYEEARPKGIKSYMLGDQNMCSYAPKENVFVFVLDRFDYNYAEGVMEEDPDFFEPLDGFTFYNNAMSNYARTRPALNCILTASDGLAYNIPTEDFYRKSWEESSPNVLQQLKEKGYHVDIYTTIMDMFSDTKILKNVDNAVPRNGQMNYSVTLKKLLHLSVYRYAPLAVKPFFFHDTLFYNEDAFLPREINEYRFADVENWAKFQYGEIGEEEKVFKFYHFLGPHPPYTMTRDGQYDANGTNAHEQTIGSFGHLYNALNKMKELGIYKDASIIITADHGSAIDDAKPMQKETRIGLLYKPSGKEGTPLEFSSAQVSVLNIPATIIKEIGGEYGHLPRPLDEISETEDVDRYYYKSIVDSDYVETEYYKYIVRGDASNLDNWEIIDHKEGIYPVS